MSDAILPKPQTDLPRPELDLPLPEKELPAGESEYSSTPPPAVPSQYRQEHTSVQPQMQTQSETQYPPQYEQQVRTLLSWQGMGRPFKQHGREYYINCALIVMIIEVLLFLFAQYVLMLVVISMLFVVVALAVVPPHTVRYRISTEGIGVDDYFYLWQELYDFYFKQVNGVDILHIRTKDEYTTDISILIGDMHKDHLQSILLQYLPYRESVPYSFIEKSGDWLTRTFPLDRLPGR